MKGLSEVRQEFANLEDRWMAVLYKFKDAVRRMVCKMAGANVLEIR